MNRSDFLNSLRGKVTSILMIADDFSNYHDFEVYNAMQEIETLAKQLDEQLATALVFPDEKSLIDYIAKKILNDYATLPKTVSESSTEKFKYE